MAESKPNSAEWSFMPVTGSACDHVHGPAGCCSHDHARLGQHHPGVDALCLENVSFSYQSRRLGAAVSSEKLALRNVTLHVERGVNLGIIGPNGAGKSTLLKIIVGLLGGHTGKVTVEGLSPRQACRKGGILGYVPQRLEAEFKFPVSAQQVVMMGLTGKTGFFSGPSREDRDYALEMMRRVGVVDLRYKTIGELSGGQQQRVFIARALAPQSRILVLDEPLSAVDEAGQQQILELIRQLHATLRLTVIIVSHDIQALAAGCNRVACLRHSIHYHDTPAGLTREVLAELFAHDIAPVLAPSPTGKGLG